MYELFDHTADLGIRVHAASLAELLCDAACGLFEVIAGDLAQVRPTRQERLRVDGTDPTWLLFDLVSELHAAFELRRFLGRSCEVVIDAAGLDASVQGEPYDPRRHLLAHEIKAVTQHGLWVRQAPEGWEAEFIVDI